MFIIRTLQLARRDSFLPVFHSKWNNVRNQMNVKGQQEEAPKMFEERNEKVPP